jgi:hypothetical protein
MAEISHPQAPLFEFCVLWTVQTSPLGTYLFKPSNKNQAETSGSSDLFQHWFHDLLCEAGATAECGAFELSPDGLRERATWVDGPAGPGCSC